jgi:ribonuclease HII
MAFRSSQSGPTPEAAFAYGASAAEIIIGLDEVGRGAWAGPVVAGAVAMRADQMILGVNDSKKVSRPKRIQLDRTIKSVVEAIGVGWVSSTDVDRFGLSWAVVESGRRALMELDMPEARLFIDGSWNYPQQWRSSTAIVRGDSQLVPIAAASIVAKVARDRYMALLNCRYPGYEFSANVGYGTAHHRAGLEAYGVCPAHRHTYKPVQHYKSYDD